MGDKGKQAVGQQKVMQSLNDDLEREQQQWKPQLYEEHPASGGVSRADWHAAVLWMERQCYRFRFHSDTLCLSVALLDAFLGQVKAKAKYITCVALTCLYLAAKLCEEDEVVPAITYVVERARPGCSVADVLRMERVVLDKLSWQIRLVTPLNFLHSLHCLLVAACPGLLPHPHPQAPLSAHRQLCGLTERLLHLVTHPRTLTVPPSCLAAALICDELRRCQIETASFIDAAHRLIQRSRQEVVAGCARVRAVLGRVESVLVRRAPRATPAAAAKRPRQRADSRSFSRPAKRKLVSPEPADDIVYDIRCLYAGEEDDAPHGTAPSVPEFPELSQGAAAQTCALLSHVSRLSYADVLRRHLPAESVTAA